jgi:hypothetical protein
MEIKKTIKTDMVLKDARLVDGNIVDDSGEVVNLVEVISKIYGEDEFKLALTRSTSEEVELSDEE